MEKITMQSEDTHKTYYTNKQFKMCHTEPKDKAVTTLVSSSNQQQNKQIKHNGPQMQVP